MADRSRRVKDLPRSVFKFSTRSKSSPLYGSPVTLRAKARGRLAPHRSGSHKPASGASAPGGVIPSADNTKHPRNGRRASSDMGSDVGETSGGSGGAGNAMPGRTHRSGSVVERLEDRIMGVQPSPPRDAKPRLNNRGNIKARRRSLALVTGSPVTTAAGGGSGGSAEQPSSRRPRHGKPGFMPRPPRRQGSRISVVGARGGASTAGGVVGGGVHTGARTGAGGGRVSNVTRASRDARARRPSLSEYQPYQPVTLALSTKRRRARGHVSVRFFPEVVCDLVSLVTCLFNVYRRSIGGVGTFTSLTLLVPWSHLPFVLLLLFFCFVSVSTNWTGQATHP